MDSPAAFPDSPMEPDDAAYPCKGCGEILEEGKAFELAGNRWHIDCFRCNTCGTLLDSDANLLLLGDGSLICNNCTYSCSSCGNKIEDLAILTGDQAFCANCFKCRNCKKKIENLRYARTSQGIFCMECHESLMARRRKKTARNAAQRQKSSNSAMHLDKSLPSLPPSAAPKSAFTPELETPPSETYSDTPTEIPPRSRPADSRDDSSRNGRRDVSPAALDSSKDTLTLPSSTYKNNRHSVVSQKFDVSGGDEFLIPLAFDPTPPTGQPPRAPGQWQTKIADEKPRDYFGNAKTSGTSSRKASGDKHGYLQESDGNQSSPQPTSPHIAYQEKGRQPSAEVIDTIRKRKEGSTSASGSAAASPLVGAEKLRQQNVDSPTVSQSTREGPAPEEKFKLQEVPKSKRSGSSRNSRSDAMIPKLESPISMGTPREAPSSATEPKKDAFKMTPTDTQRPMLPEVNANGSPRPSYEYPLRKQGSMDSARSVSPPAALQMQYPPKRGDSLETSKLNHSLQRKEVPPGAVKAAQSQADAISDSPSSTSSATTQEAPSSLAKINGGKVISNPMESPISKNIFDSAIPPPNSQGSTPKESFTAPRAPPPPPPGSQRSRNESISTLQSEPPRNGENLASPKLPRYSHGGEFTMEEDMARILGNEEAQNHESFLRRVSNSVRHGRSFSDKGTRLSKEHRWPRSPANGNAAFGQEISSPSTSSPEHRDELSWFKNELRRERQKVVEKDQRIAELESSLNATVEIMQVNTELREKRSTMVVLDTQKEIVVRELEVLTEHIAAAKKSGEPLDLPKMSNVVLREFAGSLQKLKDSFAPQIEDLIQKRNDLMEEISNLTQMKDKNFQEFEQLSLKNAQLAELNNQLVHQIQELYKANSSSTLESNRTAPNGLGIYSHHKDKSQTSVDQREMRPSLNDVSLPESNTLIHQEEAEPATVLTAPQVVNIRKGQPKKFNWKKGGQNVAKGVTKGLKGAFSSGEPKYQREGQYTEGMPYAAMIQGQGPEYGTTLPPRSGNSDLRQGFGFFGNQKGSNKSSQWKMHSNGSSPALAVEAPTGLFGSDLEQRVDYEKVSIPGIVTRCIEEVELRGMDVEGIYRKSGGNSQIQSIIAAFSSSPDSIDISDPDLDINAVTSCLKQYFRRLPTPLITYDVYDKLLDTLMIGPGPERVDAMHRAISDLPRTHRDVLEFLIFHLKRVVERENENKMTSLNIAVVFAPTIMRPESVQREMTESQRKNEAVQFLVENCHGVFLGSN